VDSVDALILGEFYHVPPAELGLVLRTVDQLLVPEFLHEGDGGGDVHRDQ
jgi:hypothetical protein